MIHRLLLAGASALAIATAAPAFAEDGMRTFDIPAQPLSSALLAYSRATDTPVIASMDLLAGKTAPAIKGDMAEGQALAMLLQGTGLRAERGATGSIVVERVSADPQSGSAAGDGADAGTVQALIVTAQKKEEDIQDVPIAISAFTQESLQEQKIEGGFDLLKAIPNVTFSKNNFSSYNFSIRGIGTKAVSVATDPGVAVAFNNSALIRNRLFEQEYYDLDRVEVLRGPQGTLYGRNATAGVINVISKKPDLSDFSGQIKAEVGNYDARRGSGFINVPIVADKLAVRLAGAFTQRDGYDYNSITKHAINGRDLWSTRLTVGFQPVESLRANLIWERFNENDDRSRTSKQLCHRDPGPESIGSYQNLDVLTRAALSQGCLPGSLYDNGAFGTPNGLSIPFMLLGAGAAPGFSFYFADNPGGNLLVDPNDPYRGMTQSHNLREIASVFDPRYRAKADVFELNIDFDITPALTLTSQTLYNKDNYYSTQDYNRFNSYPVIRDTSADYLQSWQQDEFGNWSVVQNPSGWRTAAPGGFFCDPQLGCSNTIAGLDMSRARSSQFSQEFRLQSDFKGPLNFSAGVNYTRYKTLEDYFVFFNLVTAIADALNWQGDGQAVPFGGECQNGFYTFGGLGVITSAPPGSNGCVYIDPNPLESINGEGHNYFRSQNPYKLSSAAAFGELYWQVAENVKVTAGLRYTDDRKTFTRIPSQLLLSTSAQLGGTVDRGYPVAGVIKQHWGELSGRLGVDWSPQLQFTDQTMLYAFYSRGYKGGGANPPGIGFIDVPFSVRWNPDVLVQPTLYTPGYKPTFNPEFVNAFELGAKNTLLQGGLVLNGSAFFYDYKDYQVSKIVDRTAVNENFDATVWGLELESVWRPSRNLRVNLALGYEDTSIADGERSIDLMDRTQSVEGYAVLKPWIQLPSNCVVTIDAIERSFAEWFGGPSSGVVQLCPGSTFFDLSGVLPNIRDGFPNDGQGVYVDLSGKQLPNTPHWTQSLGVQYSHPFGDGWEASVRADFYHQSQSFHRVYNSEPYDKLRGWTNTNLSFWVQRPEDSLKIEVYVKNMFDKTPITDAFLNSDDTSLTTNVFTLDPKLIGVSVTKGF